MKLINIGGGSYISDDKILLVAHATTLPIKILIKQAKNNGEVIVSTYGKKTRSVIVTTAGKLILSNVTPETLYLRCNDLKRAVSKKQ